MTTVVTGWTGRGYDELGSRFMATFDEFWPQDVTLFMYVDQPAIYANRFLDRIHTYPLAECEGLFEFRERHKDNLAAKGRLSNLQWKEQERINCYSFRWDAVKFATQLFIPEAAAKHLPDGEILAWFDADVQTIERVPKDFIEGLLDKADVCYLGRQPKHSEIGFWAIRLSRQTRKFLKSMADLYRTDEVLKLPQTHSAYVWDHCRQGGPFMVGRNLTPGGNGHVWPASPLGAYTQHLKGKRKWRPH